MQNWEKRSTSLVYPAAVWDIKVESVESKLEGDIDLRRSLGISDQGQRGYQAVRVNFVIKSDASPEQLAKLAKFSPIYDPLANPVPISIHIESR